MPYDEHKTVLAYTQVGSAAGEWSCAMESPSPPMTAWFSWPLVRTYLQSLGQVPPPPDIIDSHAHMSTSA